MLATVEDWGEEILPEGVGVNGKKMGQGEGEGKEKLIISSAPPSARLFTNPLPVKHPRWRHRKPYLLSHVPLQNNACTAGYNKIKNSYHEFSGVLFRGILFKILRTGNTYVRYINILP